MKRLSFAWHKVATGDEGPGPRSRHGLVYDRSAKAIVLFGGINWDKGSCRSDTWELRRGQWSKVSVRLPPPPRHRGAMVFDSERGFSVLFGGQTQGTNSWPMVNDTWLYENRCWTKQSGWFWKCPSPRCGHSMAFDEQMGVTVLFGGISPQDQPLGDTWTFDGNAWRNLNVIAPPARRYAAFTYHPGLKGCLLHGGAVDDNGQKKFGDSWLFREGEWSQLGEEYDTDPRDDHGCAFHHAAGKLVMLEGLLRDNRGDIKREVLGLTKTGWRPVDVSPVHPRHQCSPLAYDSVLGGLVLHGGEAGHGGPQFDQTLILRLES